MAQQIERVPLSEIIARSEFAAMTSAQKVWVKIFLTTTDAVQATKIAYPRTSAKSLASRACHVQSAPKIKRLLRLAFGEPENPMEPLLNDLRRAIRLSIKRDGGLSDNTMTAIKFFERVAGKKIGKVSHVG